MTEVPSSTSAPTQAAAPAQAVSTPAANTAPSKIKVDWEDGNFEELTSDDLINNYKLTKREASQLRKQMDPVMQFLSALQGGELDALSHLNIPQNKILEFAEKALTKHLEWENMSPEQKALIQKEKEIAERERRYKEWEAEQEAARQQQMSQQALAQVQEDIVQAIGELGLEGRPTPRLIRRVAEQLKAQLESEMPMDARKASRHEWDGIQKELSEFQLMMVKKDPNKFVQSLPKEVRDAIRNYEVNAGSPFQRASTDDEQTSSSGRSKNVVDFDYLDKKYGDNKRKRMK